MQTLCGNGDSGQRLGLGQHLWESDPCGHWPWVGRSCIPKSRWNLEVQLCRQSPLPRDFFAQVIIRLHFMTLAAQPSRSCLGLVLSRRKGNSVLAGPVERSLLRAEVCVQCLSSAPVLEVTLTLVEMCFDHHLPWAFLFQKVGNHHGFWKMRG